MKPSKRVLLLGLLLKTIVALSSRKFVLINVTSYRYTNFLCFLYTEEISIFPNRSPVILPDLSLTSSIDLACVLTPTTLILQGYRARWITPAGEIIVSTNSRYGTYTGGILDTQQIPRPSTLLLIQKLSYQDAGLYICEGQRANTSDASVWVSATVELRLNCEYIYHDKKQYEKLSCTILRCICIYPHSL